MKVFISSIQLLVDRFRDELNASNIEASNESTSYFGLKAHLKSEKYIFKKMDD